MSKPVPTQMVKVTTPVVGSRTKPAAPAVIVFDRNAKPNKEGRIPVTVLSVNRKALPRDRFHTLKAGETLTNVAKQYRVTPKSLLVANAVTNPSALHVGSRIRVPGTFDVVLDNQKIDFDVQPRLENGIPLAPFRQIFEHAGGVVVWNNENQAIRAANDRTDVRLQIGSKQASVNQTVVVMDREAFLDSGRTIVPLGFLEKALDMKAEYDPKTGAILFSRK
jgi:LysM repeat protein